MRKASASLFVLLTPLFACSEKPADQHLFDHELTSPDASLSVYIGKPSPSWFSPHPLEIWLVHGEQRRRLLRARVANDGATPDEDNVLIDAEGDDILVCVRGDEQADMLYRISLKTNATSQSETDC